MSETNYKRALVTGSTGMLGSHLVAELLRRGYDDIVLPVRNPARLAALQATLAREGLGDGLPASLHPVEVALNDPNGLREAFAGVDVVFHCAAAVSMDEGQAQELIETNVEMTEHVVDAAVACRVRRLVHTSSVAALGEARPGESLIDEGCELENLSGSSPYGISKFFSENRAGRGVLQGLEVTIVNPGIILGAGDWNSGGSAQIVSLAASGILFYTPGAMGYVDVRDVARAEALLAEAPYASMQRFILVGGNMTYRELISSVARLSGRRPPVVRAGRGLLGAAWRGDKLLAALGGREARFTRPAAESAMRTSLYDGGKITRALPGFEYTPLAQTLERVVKAYTDECKKK